MPHGTGIPAAVMAQLGPSYALMLQLAHYSPSLVALCNLDGDLIYLNPAGRRLIGVDNADIFPLRMTDYVVPGQRAMVMTEIVPTARDHGLWQGRMQLINVGNAAVIDVERTTFRIQDAAGNITGFVSVMHEIADAADNPDAMRQLSHDFSNLVTSVHSGFAAIGRRTDDPTVSAIALQGKNVAEEGLIMAKRLRGLSK